MKISGEYVLNAPVERVWSTLLDPAVLVRALPGCEQLTTTGENRYDMTVTMGVAAIRGTYAGTCELSDLDEPNALVMNVQGAGAPGTIGAKVDVRFADQGDGTTKVGYDADAVVGGMVGGVGQRMLTSVSKRMAGEFFGNVNDIIDGAAPAEPELAGALSGGAGGGGAVTGQVFAAPKKAGALGGGSDDFVKGMVVGAGLVALGVVLGGILGRRR